MQCKLKFQRHLGKSVKLMLKYKSENSLVGQWLGFCASTEGGMGSIPGWGTKDPESCLTWQKKKKIRKENGTNGKE